MTQDDKASQVGELMLKLKAIKEELAQHAELDERYRSQLVAALNDWAHLRVESPDGTNPVLTTTTRVEVVLPTTEELVRLRLQGKGFESERDNLQERLKALGF